MQVHFYKQTTLPETVENGSIVFNATENKIYLGDNDTWVCYTPYVHKTVEKILPTKFGYGTDAGTSKSVTLDASKFFIVGRCASLTLTLPEGSDYDCKEYCIQFFVPSGFSLNLPSSVKWLNGTAPTFEENTCCQLVICNNCATYGIFKA